MAGFGSISLMQTVIGTLIDQRAIVLYKQPSDFIENTRTKGKFWEKEFWKSIDWQHELFGNAFKYEELFAGLAGLIENETLTQITNVTGKNPYGITYIDAVVNIESDLCDHPVENGTLITDASIILPVTAEVKVAMPTFFAERIYNQMYDMYKTKQDRILLQTKYGVYNNLVLKNISYELEKGTIDRTIFTLSLREIQEVQSYGDLGNVISNSKNVAVASDTNTINTGSQMAVGG